MIILVRSMRDISNEYNRKNKKTFKDLLGNYKDNIKGKVSITDKGVYHDLNSSFFNQFVDYIVELHKNDTKGEYTSYNLLIMDDGGRYPREFGCLLTKNDEPYILSPIPGDYRGCYITNNNIFMVAGHDGVSMFNLDDPTLYDSMGW